MTDTNDQNNTPSGDGSSTTANDSIIAQQQCVSEQQQQHFVLSPVNSSAPMIITTPLAAPAIVTQQLPTTALSTQLPTAATVTVTPVGATDTTIQNKTKSTEKLACSLCNKVYRSSAGLRYHKRKRHRDEGILKAAQLHRVRCLENGCTYQMLAISDLRNHLANHHLKPEYKTTEEKKFNSFTEFTEWKSTFEQSSGSKYVKNCGSKGKSENQTTEYYYCNRTGLYKQARQGWRRNSKTHDSFRCGIHCTSSMKVDIARNDQISVQYYPTHYGHTAEPPLQVPSSTNNTNSTMPTINSELVEQASVQKQTIPPIQTVVQTAVQQQHTETAKTDHCVRLQHQHHAQTSNIIINIAPIFLLNIMTKKGSSTSSSPSTSLDNGSSSGRFVCSMCTKVYRSGAGLRYHKRKRHRGMVEPTALHRVKCQEPGCTYQMLAISDLRNHLASQHNKPEYKCTEERKFTSVASFTDWKSSFETSTGSKYVKNCGAKGKSDNQTTEYYYCNRTGPYKTVGQGLRRNKSQGSLRGGIHCTSSMKVEIQSDEHITVQYYPAHYGHSSLPPNDEPRLSENSTTITGGNIRQQQQQQEQLDYHHCHHQQQQRQRQHHQLDNSQHMGNRSSSSSPGSSTTSPSGSSNSNSTYLPLSIERQSVTTTNSYLKNNNTNNNNNSIHNQMPHCIIISPSLLIEEGSSTHSNQHHTPVFVVQQHLPTSSHAITSPPKDVPVKKEKCVSDIMHEAFQLLSYWPLDHHHGLITSENEQQISHSHFNMDEHLMF